MSNIARRHLESSFDIGDVSLDAAERRHDDAQAALRSHRREVAGSITVSRSRMGGASPQS